MSQNEQNLIWVDMEMTGLEPETDRILEIAMIVTDKELNVLAEGPVRASQYDEARAAAACLEFMKAWVPERQTPMCGNSIGQDRRFMVKYMPELECYFNYRNVDVSTIKELVRRWKPEILDAFTKTGTHQALDDIRESIAELQFYRKHVFTI